LSDDDFHENARPHMNHGPSISENDIPMAVAHEPDVLPGVFAFLDASLPEGLKRAAIENDSGIGRRASMPSETQSRQWVMNYKIKPPGDRFFMGYIVEGFEREAIAKFLNATFRLQWKGCPLRSYLAEYRLYHRDDMADALAAAYCLHKRGNQPEAALMADYSVECQGLLRHADLDEIRNDTDDSLWKQFRPFFEEGDRMVYQDRGGSDYYLMVRGDRLVWEVERIHKLIIGSSLKRRAALAHFKSLGGTKGFLNGEFTWPSTDWINPVSDEEEAASLRKPVPGLATEVPVKE
jgi:hypothetical protein